VLAVVLAPAAELRFDVRHDHWWRSAPGVLTADASGLKYEERGDHNQTLAWQDIQQLTIEPDRLTVLTYSDNPWKLGADRAQRFAGAFESLAPLAKEKLDARAVIALAEERANVLWKIPVKLRQGFGGSEGVLVVASDAVLYSSPEKGESRTWLFAEIDNISSSGPYDMSVTTFERSKADRKTFNFQLKQRLDERQYNALWRRLNQTIQEKQ
jgi:hypothetical protein